MTSNLPPALLARLQKRGLLAAAEKKKNDEEVFAEDYDKEATTKEPSTNDEILRKKVEEEDEMSKKYLVHESAKCPNKTNIYHECSDYCFIKFGKHKFRPNLKNISLKQRMLRRYPLPDNWLEVADPITNRFYYWNSITGDVSWLSPAHPRSKISPPESKMKLISYEQEFEMKRRQKTDDRDDADRRSKRRGSSHSSSGSSDSDREDSRKRRRDRRRERDNRSRRDRDRNKKRNRRDDDLDPMDPAAYSDIARGTWTSGLDVQAAVKTGVDHTASGPLFQQRPYPSPGDILRANASINKGKNEDSDND